MAATLSSDMDNTDKVVGFLDEARNLNLKVLRPNINHSAYMFEATHADTIQYGLGAIKGVGQSVCEAIVKERLHYGPYTSLLDFCTRVTSAKLNRRALEAMIHAGALDELGKGSRLCHAATARSHQSNGTNVQRTRVRAKLAFRQTQTPAHQSSN